MDGAAAATVLTHVPFVVVVEAIVYRNRLHFLAWN